MIANGLLTLIGLYLAYLSIFGLVPASGMRWQEVVLGAVIVALARLARLGDVSGWQSATNTVAGAVLIAAVAANWLLSFSPLMLFWIDLWIGLVVACLALWAALYHPERTAKAPKLMQELTAAATDSEPARRRA
jgi:hypothetical protein